MKGKREPVFGTGDRSAFVMRQLVGGKVVGANFSAHPRGQERTRPPRSSIWPEAKFANAGNCGRLS